MKRLNASKASRFVVAAILLSIGLLSSYSSASAAESPWPMFHHDLHLTGRSPYVGAQTSNLKWTYTTGGAITFSSPAIGADGTIYIGSHDRMLHAINPDGTNKWTYSTGGEIESSPAIGKDGTIYVGSKDNKLHAVNTDGSPKWQFTTERDVDSSPSIGIDGTVYVGSDDNKLYALNPDGTKKWSSSLSDIGDYHCPSIADDGTIYFASTGNLYAINPDDGTKKWVSPLGSYHYFSSAAIANDGTVYIGTRVTNKLHAINPENGNKYWSYSTGGWADLSPSIGIDGTIYIGSTQNQKVHAVNPDGTPKSGWPFTVGGNINYSSAVIGGEGTIYIGDEDGVFYALEDTGLGPILKWSYTTGDQISSSPAIGVDGTVYVGSRDGKLYAFGGAIMVEVDIKPGSYPNTINLGSHGLIPVAILSSPEFDATSVDPDTVELAGSGVSMRGKSNKYMAHGEDVNGDGMVDLVVQVATENLDAGSFQDGYAILTGRTYGGQTIEGADEITIVPPE